MSSLENKISALSSRLAGLIIILAPIWAFLTVWVYSGLGHYTALRLVIEVLLALVILGAVCLLFLDKKLVRKLIQQKWFWLVAAFILLEIIWGIVSYFTGRVSLKALGYAWIIDLRYLLFFMAVFVVSNKNNWLKDNWKKLIFIPAAAVTIFAVIQFLFLPYDFLAHFGYGPHTIFPYQTINHNKSYERAISFTRGSNSLGAYLVIILALIVGALTSFKSRLASHKRYLYIGLLVVSLAALAFSFSRSAWLGAVVAVALISFLIAKLNLKRLLTIGGIILVVILVGLAVFLPRLEDNAVLQNYVFHTEDDSLVKTKSDSGHITALKNGLNDLASDPLGNGPGASGPASVYNSGHTDRIYENYYLMLAGETGWLGLVLLIAIFVTVAVNLYKRKTKLALALLASFIGLAFVNFLLPAWTDVTLAYVFWGLAGTALAANEEHPAKRQWTG